MKRLGWLFLGWLVAVISLRATNASSYVTFVYAMFAGLVCYRACLRRTPPDVAWHDRWIVHPLAHCFVAASLVIASITLIWAYSYVTWDDIGHKSDFGWGDVFAANGYDDAIATVLSPAADLVATSRGATKAIAPDDLSETIFVFVHAPDQEDSPSNLALRYDTSEEGGGYAPTLHWIGAYLLQVTVSAKEVYQVTRQRDVIDGVKIIYSLPRADCPPAYDFWQRPPLGPRCT